MVLKTLFSPKKIGNVQIKNRIVRSATHTGGADDEGKVTDELVNFYKEIAKGGTGLIITEITSIDEEGKGMRRNQICLFDDVFIPGNKKLVEAVHEYAEVKIAPQLSHAGRQGPTPVAPSPYTHKYNKKVARVLTSEDIEGVIKNFADAGRRAYESGYDMIQLQAGHGWLLSSFLSPYLNNRTDEYGGSVEGRTKILVDIYDQTRDQVGKEFPIFLKLQTLDFVPGGLNLDDAEQITKILIDTGYDAIEPAGGSSDTILDPAYPTYPFAKVDSANQENYFLNSVKRLKPMMKDRPVILMGGVRNPEIIEKLLQDGETDLISMSRPLIWEPDLPNRWESGDISPPLCTSCNQCLMTSRGGIIHCPLKKKAERRKKRQQEKQAK